MVIEVESRHRPLCNASYDKCVIVRHAAKATGRSMTAAWDDEAEFEILCGDEWIAGTSGTREGALREAFHYAAQYAADGPITINEIVRRKRNLSGASRFPGFSVNWRHSMSGMWIDWVMDKILMPMLMVLLVGSVACFFVFIIMMGYDLATSKEPTVSLGMNTWACVSAHQEYVPGMSILVGKVMIPQAGHNISVCDAYSRKDKQ